MLSALVSVTVRSDPKTLVVPSIQTKKPRKKKEKKVRRSEADDAPEYSKFRPLKTDKEIAPLSYEEEADDGFFAPVDEGDDCEFEDENAVYKKQDLEWEELMKEIVSSADEIDSDSSSVVESASSMSRTHTDVDDSPSVSRTDVVFDSPYVDGENFDMNYEDSNTFSFIRKEKEKQTKKYTGVAITEDLDFIP